MRSRTNASSTTCAAKSLTALPAARPPSRDASVTADLRAPIEPSQVASFGVTSPAASIPGSFAATICCSLRRLVTPSAIASAKIGTIQSR
jgi:hypothetical protein